MPTFTVHKGKHIPGSHFAKLARIMGRQRHGRAKDLRCRLHRVEVTGHGRERDAEALWPLDDASAEIPSQIANIVEIA